MTHKDMSLSIKELPKEQAVAFIRRYHYSKVVPRLCRYFLGIYQHEKLLGVVELGWGTQPLQTLHKLFPSHNLVTADYLEIGKMCFLPEMNHTQYFGSLTLSYLIKWLQKYTDCLFLYTLADGIEGKCGYVYQASNFIIAEVLRQVYIVTARRWKRYTLEVQGFCWKKMQFMTEWKNATG